MDRAVIPFRVDGSRLVIEGAVASNEGQPPYCNTRRKTAIAVAAFFFILSAVLIYSAVSTGDINFKATSGTFGALFIVIGLLVGRQIWKGCQEGVPQ